MLGANASYTFGAATAGVIYTNVRYSGLGIVETSGPNPFGYGGTAVINTVEVNLRYFITPALLVGVMGRLTRAAAIAGREDGALYQQVGGGAHYSLSKQTELYALAMYEHASGVDSTGRAAVAAISGLSPSATGTQTAFRIGITHRFLRRT